MKKLVFLLFSLSLLVLAAPANGTQGQTSSVTAAVPAPSDHPILPPV